MKSFALTTVDNPYDPIGDFDNWMEYDEKMGYFTNSYLARIAVVSNAFSEEDYDLAVESAMKEIVSFNPDLYKIVTKEENE